MKNKEKISPSSNSRGAAIFKKMIEDKRAIREHIQKGGKISDLKEKFNFVKPLSITGKWWILIWVFDDIQFSRKRKFDRWFFAYNDGTLIKEDGLALVEGVEIYNAMVLKKKHSQLTELILAFKDLNERAGEK